MSDRNVKKMAQFLRKGATMLDKYCPQCQNILFKLKNGKIFCPVCESEVVIVKESSPSPLPSTVERNNDIDPSTSLTFGEINNNLSQLLSQLVMKLKSIDDILLIERYLNSVEHILRIMVDIRSLQRN